MIVRVALLALLVFGCTAAPLPTDDPAGCQTSETWTVVVQDGEVGTAFRSARHVCPAEDEQTPPPLRPDARVACEQDVAAMLEALPGLERATWHCTVVFNTTGDILWTNL